MARIGPQRHNSPPLVYLAYARSFGKILSFNEGDVVQFMKAILEKIDIL